MVNRAAVNAETINGIVPDVVQRTVLVSRAAAYCSATGLVLSRGPVVCSASASAGVVPRQLQRGSIKCRSTALVGVSAALRIKSPVTSKASARAFAAYTIYPRIIYESPVYRECRAEVYAKARFLQMVKAQCHQASIVDTNTDHVFAYFRMSVNAQAKSVLKVDGEVFKKIPYDLDAPDERCMQVSAESRVMTCQ